MEIVNTTPNLSVFLLVVLIGALVGLIAGYLIDTDPSSRKFSALVASAMSACLFCMIAGGVVLYDRQQKENEGISNFESFYDVTIEYGEIPTTHDPRTTVVEVTSTNFSGKKNCIVSVEADTYVLTCP